jgi:two-component system response regulator YesN
MTADILIVDDERIICEGLRKLIEHLRLEGVRTLRYAVTAQDALEIMAAAPPDIVFTDIRMPRVDGLELVRRMRARGVGARVVILSGHDDFEYAPEALRLGAVDYLLKPVTADTLARLLRRLLAGMELERARCEREAAERLHGICQELDALLAGLVPAALAVAATPSSHRDGLPGATAVLSGRLPAAWHALASRLLATCTAGWRQAVLSLRTEEPPRGAATALSGPRGVFPAGRASAFVLECPGEAAARSDHTAHAAHAVALDASDPGHLVCSSLESQLLATARVLCPRAAARMDWAAPMVSLPETAQHEAPARGGPDPRVEVVLALGAGWATRSPPQAPWELDRASLLATLEPGSLDRGEVAYITSARAYISEHFRESIDLGSLAQRLGLSYRYLSTLFKRECGAGFATYLRDVRMREARRLLESGRHPIREVALGTGYRSPKHFSRVFRGVYGVPPKRFQLHPGS